MTFDESKVNVFSHEEFGNIRTITRNNEVWFVGKDVCDCLEIADSRKSIGYLDEDERTTSPVTDSSGRTQEMLIINESGLYSLILRSRKPEAKRFKKWVTSEVLPSIRKTGLFATLPMISRDGEVIQIGGELFVSTVAIADVFQKEHRNVVRDFQKAMGEIAEIRSDLSTSSGVSYLLEPDVYIDKYGRTQSCYRVNRPLFNYVVLHYTGDKANIYRMKFIDQFEAMDKFIKVQLTKQMLYQKEGDQAVYVIKNEHTGMVKVGVAKDPEARMNTLANQSGCDLQMVYCTPKCKNAYEVEQNIHKMLDEHRCRGEWFDVPEVEVVSTLQEMALDFGSGFLGLEA